jgi:hypothetical protein
MKNLGITGVFFGLGFIAIEITIQGKAGIPPDTNGPMLANIISISCLSYYGRGVRPPRAFYVI